MSNYTYTSGRPAGNISPAAQRSSMQTNNDNNALIWAEDHYGFNDADNLGGEHKFIRLPENNTPVAGTPPSFQANIYTVPGVANTAVSQVLTQLPTVSIPMTGVRAFACFPANGTSSGAVAISNSYNVSSVSLSKASAAVNSVFTVNIASGALTGSNYCVLLSNGIIVNSGSGHYIYYTIVSQTSFTVTIADRASYATISCMVLQF